jgi:hypothetical protein
VESLPSDLEAPALIAHIQGTFVVFRLFLFGSATSLQSMKDMNGQVFMEV